MHVDPRVTVKKSLPKLKQDFSMRNASTLSLSTPLRMKPSPPTVAPPQETPAPPEPRAETPPPPPPVAPEPESAPVEAPKDEPETHQLETAEQPVGWVAWWYGQPATPAVPPIDIAPEPEEEPVKEPEVQPPPPEDPLGNDVAPPSLDVPKDSVNPSQPQARSWFGIWSAATQEVPAGLDAKTADVPAELPVKVAAPPPIEPTPPPPVTVEVVQPADQEAATSSAPPSNGYYGWGFWSRGAADTASGTTVEGEIAIAGEASESNPQKANVKLPDMVSTALRPSSVVSLPALVTQAENAKSTKIKTAKSAKLAASKKAEAVTAPPSIAPVIESSAAKKTLQKILPQNHLLPAFESCYRHPDQPSIVQQFAKIFRNSPPSKDHLHLSRQIPKVKKAVAIGVHGFFPMRLVRTVLGEPTGTSVRFANHAANSIKRWAEKNGVEIEVETIALEGEGKVADRVEMLWELLQNWIEQVRSADFIILAAHSQGVVVGIQLLARLIETGCVDNVRIGFTAMAGINLGPFGHLPTTLLTGSAKELFEFQKQESTVSKKYMEAIRVVLARDVRILYVGSIDDQLVPLESSTISTISHPYIYRAVFVDGRVHAPDFLSHLVGFAMKLRNLGVSDHRLIRELSTPLAGSLYGGEGHSRIYDDGAVYE